MGFLLYTFPHFFFEFYYFLYFSENGTQNSNIEISPIDNLQHLYFGNGQSGSWLEFIEAQPLSIGEHDFEKIQIYPNPVSDQLFITSEKSTIKTMAVFSTTGQKVLEIEGSSNSIDVSSLSKGMYFLEINS